MKEEKEKVNKTDFKPDIKPITSTDDLTLEQIKSRIQRMNYEIELLRRKQEELEKLTKYGRIKMGSK